MIAAAVYARESTDQNAVAEEAKSVTRQIEHATAYAARHGWTVPEACVFVDDGISGAEFANRPGFVRLMAALKPRPPFDVLVMSEESRLGREAIETAYALKQSIQAGVRVFFYPEDRERTFDSPTDKTIGSISRGRQPPECPSRWDLDGGPGRSSQAPAMAAITAAPAAKTGYVAHFLALPFLAHLAADR